MTNRPVTQGDIACAIRALRMKKKTDAELLSLQTIHREVEMFASRVIVAAAEFMLDERNGGKK